MKSARQDLKSRKTSALRTPETFATSLGYIADSALLKERIFALFLGEQRISCEVKAELRWTIISLVKYLDYFFVLTEN